MGILCSVITRRDVAMYRVGIKRPFVCRHFLVGDFEGETRPHSHDYTAEWLCSTEGLDANGFAVDIALLEATLERILESISGRLLNELPFFQDTQTSVENVARYIQEEALRALEEAGFDLKSLLDSEIRIWESETAWASFIKEGL
jgi:6-pyruvoyl-tetrahydropterin synthase